MEAHDVCIYDDKKCFDSLWAFKSLNDVYELGFKNDKLPLLNLENYRISENVLTSDWPLLKNSLQASEQVVAGLLTFIGQHSNTRRGGNSSTSSNGGNVVNGAERPGSALEIGSVSVSAVGHHNSRYKTSMCRDLSLHGSCPRGKNCSFAHSAVEMEQ